MSMRASASSACKRADGNLFPVFLVAAAVLVYLNSLTGDFVFDDEPHILLERGIRDLGDLPTVLSTPLHRPLVSLTLAINYALDELEPRGYHLLNLIIHTLAALALYGLVRRTLLRPPWRDRFQRSAPILALCVSLIWVVHPLNTQAVTYVIQRCESMMGLFYILTLYCAVRLIDAPSQRRWLVGAALCSAAGMTSKEVMITAPIAVVLYDWVFAGGGVRTLLSRRRHLYGALAATWLVLALSSRVSDLFAEDASAGFGLENLTAFQYALSQPLVMLHYLRLSVWPHPLVLDYMWPASHTWYQIDPPMLATLKVAGPILVVALLLGAVVWGLARRSAFGFLGAAFFLVLIPTSSFLPIADLMFEHRMYLPLAAVVTATVVGSHQMLRSIRRPSIRHVVASTAVALIAVVLSVLTIKRNRDYHSDVTLWTTVAQRRPHNPRGWFNCGNAHDRASLRAQLQPQRWSQQEKALSCWQRAIDLTPQHHEARNNMAMIWLRRNDLDRAIEHFDAAIDLAPNEAEYHHNLGRALMVKDDLITAEEEFHRAIELKRDFAKPYNNLGLISWRRGQIDTAAAYFHKAIERDRQFLEAHVNLGSIWLARNDAHQAIRAFREGLRALGENAVLHANLGDALAAANRFAEAEEAMKLAIAIDPSYPETYYKLARLYTHRSQRRDFEAVAAYRIALSLRPNWPQAQRSLAWVLATTRDLRLSDSDEALELAQQANLATGKKHAIYFDTLAAAYAIKGQFEKATQAAQFALVLAGQAQMSKATVQAIRTRRDRYRLSLPYREPP